MNWIPSRLTACEIQNGTIVLMFTSFDRMVYIGFTYRLILGLFPVVMKWPYFSLIIGKDGFFSGNRYKVIFPFSIPLLIFGPLIYGLGKLRFRLMKWDAKRMWPNPFHGEWEKLTNHPG